MRLPVEWIKEVSQVDAGPEEIADRLTMAGLEVEEKAESAIGAVLDIKVTPNRGDCLSVRGIARELRAAYGMAISAHAQSKIHNPKSSIDDVPTSVTIEAPDLCPRYAARLVRNLRIGPSPQWMQDRITAAGMRPINNIVDVTNYVMLESGQPLHAFDYDTLKEDRIVVRRARTGETLTTLDGAERSLTPDMLVIADAERPIALAGMMGGGDTEMTERTTTLLLESAHFHPLAVRRTAKALDMRTEASYRFERYVDPAGVVAAADRACELIAMHGMGDVVPGVVDVIAEPVEVRKLNVRTERVSEMLGYTVTDEEVASTLTRLGFMQGDPHTFTIPTWRPDIVREIDLVEEVGRVLGYERIPEALPSGETTQGMDSAEGRFAEAVRDVLAGAGMQEVVSHSLLAETALDDVRAADSRVAIRSALSAELSGLRRSLVPGLVDALERNARRGQTPLAFFEIGHVFHRGAGDYAEGMSVAGVLAGPFGAHSWQKESRAPAADYYAASGLVDLIVERLHVAGLSFTPSDDPRLHPGRSADILLDGQVIGHVGELHPRISQDLTTRHRVIVFEVSVDSLMAAAARSPEFAPLTPYPAVVRDLAPRVGSDVAYRSVERAIESAEVPFLERLALTDLYTGPPLPEGIRSLTLSLTFRATDRTLTDDEVNRALDEIRTRMERECGATFAG